MSNELAQFLFFVSKLLFSANSTPVMVTSLYFKAFALYFFISSVFLPLALLPNTILSGNHSCKQKQKLLQKIPGNSHFFMLSFPVDFVKKTLLC